MNAASFVRKYARPFVIGTILSIAFQALASLHFAYFTHPSAEILPEHIREFGVFDSSWQRHVYQAVLIVLLFFTALNLLVVRPNSLESTRRTFEFFTNRILTNAIFVALIVCGFLFQDTNEIYGIASMAVALGVPWLPRLNALQRQSVRIAIGCGAALTTLILIAPGIIKGPRLGTVSDVVNVVSHYAGVLGPMVKVSLGVSPDRIRLNYGAFSLIASLSTFFVARLDLRDMFNVVMFFQAAFIVALFVAAYLYDRSKSLLLMAFVAILVAPFAATIHPSTYYPNQSGLRYLGLLLGLISLKLIKPGREKGLGLGLVASALVFYNPETGAAIGLGMAFRQILTGMSVVGRIRGAIEYFLTFLVGFGLGVAVLLGVLFYVVGVHPANFSPYLFRFASGYGGLEFRPNSWVFLMVLGGATIMLHSSARAAQGLLTEAQGTRAAIGATLLVWMSYYVNRPHPWDLWTLVMLLLFAVADWMTFRQWHVAVERFRRGRLTLAFAAVVGVVPPLAIQNASDIWGFLFAKSPPTARFSGVGVPASIESEISQKSATVKKLVATHQLVYISLASILVALDSRVPSGLVEDDAFSEAPTMTDVRHIAVEVLSRNPELVLFDLPNETISRLFPNRTALLERIKALIGGAYRYAGPQGNWAVWAHKPT